MTQLQLATRLGVSASAVSQWLVSNKLTLRSAVRYARAIGMKPTIVTYEHSSRIHAEVFVKSWQVAGTPTSFFDLKAADTSPERADANSSEK